MMMKSIEMHRTAQELSKKGTCVLLDRSLISNYSFAHLHHQMGNISDSEFDVYCDMLTAEDVTPPPLIINLQCSEEIALQRVKYRSREGESDYNIDYLKKLTQAYQECVEDVNICSICWENDREMLLNNDTSSVLCRDICKRITSSL
jgi:deoxyadenosine/deoxycytidine kinase